MTARFYVPQLSAAESCELTGSEWHHLAHVMRSAIGDRVVLFDGNGHEADAEITTLAKSRASLRILARRTDLPEDESTIVLATAVPKADRFRWLVEKATELGVGRLIPLQTARSVVSPGDVKLDKMRTTVIEACKQSGRNRLMRVEPTMNWETLITTVVPTGSAFVADLSGALLASAIAAAEPGRPVILIVGPEGGLTEGELRLAIAAGAKSVSLGPRILRIETAALALAAIGGLRCSSRVPTAEPG